ncbi:MAG TPA: ABC transporter ATP-binding protein [Candidatus Cloacimonadota bacterium]|nr:ABC transporter ATP-binding protein [Candidatus Cloacimonadota bacterium]HQL15307.1 ABC transporter ATP-binding protein [Candidatus Cloacimonadota bacterium]
MPSIKEHLLNIRYLLPYIKQHRFALITASFLTAIVSISSLPLPLITKRLIDYSLIQRDYHDLILMTVLIILLSVILNILAFYQQKLFVSTNQTIINRIKADLLARLLRVDIPMPSSNGYGYLMSRIDDDTERIQALLVDNLLEAITSVCTLIVGVFACIIISYRLFFLILPFAPIYYICFIRYYKKMSCTLETMFEKRALVVDQLNESLALRSASRYCNDFRYPMEKYQHRLQGYLALFLKYLNIRISSDFMLSVLSAMIVAAVLFFGGRQVIGGTLSIGSLIAFNAFFGYITGPTDSIVNTVLNAQKALLSLQRLAEIYSIPLEDHEISEHDIYPIKQILLNDVSVEFDNKLILSHISLKLEAGDRVLVTGDSGSGKTTLLRLLAGAIKPSEGSILLNGHELDSLSRAVLCLSLGFVDQEPVLANDTIDANIRMFNKNAAAKDVERASQEAFVEPFVRENSEAYNFCIGANGNRLSIGQKQRIALARALIRKPQILLLDEPTSNVDKESEACIFDTIRVLSPTTILLMATHQDVPTDLFNKTLRIDKGRITFLEA